MSSPRPATSPDAVLAAGSRRVVEVIRTQQGALARCVERLPEPSVEDIHQSRVAARRLRSLLKTFRPFVDERWARLYRIDLRSLARTLAPVRDADVLMDLLDEVVASDEALRRAEPPALGIAVHRLRDGARSELHRHMREPGWRALVAALSACAHEAIPLRRTDVALADVLRRVERPWRRAARLLEQHPLSAADLHRLRLALKHCRYALETVADVRPRPAERLLKRLRRAQDAIGAHRDTLVATRWVRLQETALGREPTRQLVEVLESRQAELRAAAVERAERVLPTYADWRDAVGRLRRTTRSGRA